MKGDFKAKNCVKLKRQFEGLTQKDLADKIGTSQNTISSIENNVYQPSVGLALKISKVLNENINNLFYI